MFDVSETETAVQSFQTQKRKCAIALAPMSDQGSGHELMTMQAFQRWADELGLPWDGVLKGAGVKDPDKARASRARMKKGGAPRVRRDLFHYLAEKERSRSTRTRTGEVLVGVEDWKKLGEELAALNERTFLAMLEQLRARVSAERDSAAGAAAFGDLKPAPKDRRSK